ncbi:DNA-binding NtrC family response regulator [Sphingomonas sp. BE138]|uniref:response regulator n=1 Tax=Sphingomonas sp. BE138 TaxID=2817845 RepID=UPI00286138FF|nr:response regulator [Sphingomonas sp. BE138]MDR6790307.1 DNA-binding NtrC family response regulator [Sphingomonas sp. BE138]
MGQSKPIGSKTVLIVEAEALVRFDAVAFFEERGWRVYEAEDADQAIEVLDERGDIRVVMIDATVSGRMDGLKLAHFVRERIPPTLLFIVSGQAPVPQEALPQRATFLPKPFDLHRVLRQIEQSPVTP